MINVTWKYRVEYMLSCGVRLEGWGQQEYHMYVTRYFMDIPITQKCYSVGHNSATTYIHTQSGLCMHILHNVESSCLIVGGSTPMEFLYDRTNTYHIWRRSNVHTDICTMHCRRSCMHSIYTDLSNYPGLYE
jgi:hypothetical protein